MCGRFSLAIPIDVLREVFGAEPVPSLHLRPRYNVAPTDEIPIVVARGGGPGRVLTPARWGLVPAGSPDLRPGAKMINARAETLFEKPGFARAAEKRRCLVPADGFYEWEGQGKNKRPYRIRVRDAAAFGMAGVYERWRSPDATLSIDTVAVVTTRPNALMAGIHDRMPVILGPDDWPLWLDPKVASPEVLGPLLAPYDAAAMITEPVSTWVNDVKHDDPRCAEVVQPTRADEGARTPAARPRRKKAASSQLSFNLQGPGPRAEDGDG